MPTRSALSEARAVASRLLAPLPSRWAHVQAVGAVAEQLSSGGDLPELPVAGWLHDIGYGVPVSGFHPLDGARYLLEAGWPTEVVALVGHHTGAAYEAEERGFGAVWSELPSPSHQEQLDALCLADLTCGPDGRRLTVDARLDEILSRYEEGHPVHRAVSRSAPHLRAAARRAAAKVKSPDEWIAASL